MYLSLNLQGLIWRDGWYETSMPSFYPPLNAFGSVGAVNTICAPGTAGGSHKKSYLAKQEAMVLNDIPNDEEGSNLNLRKYLESEVHHLNHEMFDKNHELYIKQQEINNKDESLLVAQLHAGMRAEERTLFKRDVLRHFMKEKESMNNQMKKNNEYYRSKLVT